MPAERKDTWAAGKLYEPYVGRWSRLVAEDFLLWLEMPERLIGWTSVVELAPLPKSFCDKRSREA